MAGLRVATCVGGRYRLEQRVGRGGMAEVWLAVDERLGRRVALKVLDPMLTDGRDFQHEAGILADLRHPNIVTVYDGGVDDEQQFIVMEWLEGESLRERLRATGALPLADALTVGAAIASAIVYAHGRGILHNDVKPENILLDAAGEPRLTDFGVARVSGNTVATGEAEEMMATIAYVAPEVLQGAPPSAASDVYALATTIFEAVAGRLPFDSLSNSALAGQKLNIAPRPIQELAPGVPPGVAAVIGSALAFAPSDRPTAPELERILRAAIQEETRKTATLLAAPLTHPTRALPRRALAARTSHSRAPWLLGAPLALLLVVGIGAFALDRSDGDGPAGTPSPPSDSAAAAVTATPVPTSSPQQVAPPAADNDDTHENDDDDDKKDKNDREKPGRRR